MVMLLLEVLVIVVALLTILLLTALVLSVLMLSALIPIVLVLQLSALLLLLVLIKPPSFLIRRNEILEMLHGLRRKAILSLSMHQYLFLPCAQSTAKLKKRAQMRLLMQKQILWKE
jgi:hypothetical protein